MIQVYSFGDVVFFAALAFAQRAWTALALFLPPIFPPFRPTFTNRFRLHFCTRRQMPANANRKNRVFVNRPGNVRDYAPPKLVSLD